MTGYHKCHVGHRNCVSKSRQAAQPNRKASTAYAACTLLRGLTGISDMYQIEMKSQAYGGKALLPRLESSKGYLRTASIEMPAADVRLCTLYRAQ